MGSKLTTQFRNRFSSSSQSSTNLFDQIDERRAPNVKQYLRGLRNYYVLSKEIKVKFANLDM